MRKQIAKVHQRRQFAYQNWLKYSKNKFYKSVQGKDIVVITLRDSVAVGNAHLVIAYNQRMDFEPLTQSKNG